MPHIIYGLVDPRDQREFYVGRTEDVYRRFAEHLKCTDRNQATYRDTIRDATLALITACTPDELYDPVDDPRQEEAVKRLGELLGSYYAAEGVQLAIVQTMAQGLSSMANRSEHYG